MVQIMIVEMVKDMGVGILTLPAMVAQVILQQMIVMEVMVVHRYLFTAISRPFF